LDSGQEGNEGMDGHNSWGPELLWVDFCSCGYEVANSEIPGGLYEFQRYHNRQYQIKSPLPEPLHTKLCYIFPQCIVYYLPFVQDSDGFLHDVPHILLWNERSGEYAVVIKNYGDRPGERSFVWLRLKPNGYVFASLLSIPETSEESKKWRVIRAPRGSAVSRTAGGLFLQYYPNSCKALEAFPVFLANHKGVRDYLHVNSRGIYQDMTASPAQMRGEATGPEKMAMGFLSDPQNHTLIMAQEPTGSGWVTVSLVSQERAERLRAKLSGLKRNSGGIRWKPIDIPYGAMVYMDKGVVFYKVVKLRRPEGDKAGYVFEFKANRSKDYIRFPYIFRSYKKLISFVERANAFRLKMWMRTGGR
jgi:hypothetical protein